MRLFDFTHLKRDDVDVHIF